MSVSGSIYRVSVYLKGDSLVPDEVTAAVNIEPTQAHRKGHSWLTSTNRQVVEKTGFWSFSMTHESKGLNEILAELASAMNASRVALHQISGIEEAYVDVFIATDADDDGGGTCDFELDKQCLSVLAELGLAVRFTVTVVRE